MLQDPQILADTDGRRVFRAQPIVGLTKTAVGEQILTVAIILKRPRLAHQLIDDVPVVDRMLVTTHQTRQRVHTASGVPDFHTIGVQSGLHFFADQAAVDRVGVAVNVNHASRPHGDRQTQAAVQSLLGKRLQHGQLLQVTLPARRIALVQQVPQERQEIVLVGEIPTAAQLQRLVQRVLEVAMRRLGVAVLVGLSHVDSLPLQAVILQQGTVARLKLPFHRQIVDRRAQAVAPMTPRHTSQFPQRVLQTIRQRLKRLRGTQRHAFPV